MDAATIGLLIVLSPLILIAGLVSLLFFSMVSDVFRDIEPLTHGGRRSLRELINNPPAEWVYHKPNRINGYYDVFTYTGHVAGLNGTKVYIKHGRVQKAVNGGGRMCIGTMKWKPAKSIHGFVDMYSNPATPSQIFTVKRRIL